MSQESICKNCKHYVSKVERNIKVKHYHTEEYELTEFKGAKCNVFSVEMIGIEKCEAFQMPAAMMSVEQFEKYKKSL